MHIPKLTLHNYLSRHWRGKLPLLQSFFLNFLAVAALCYGISIILQSLLANFPVSLFYTNILLFIVYWLCIYPWQAIGVIRASENPDEPLQHSLWIKPIQGAVLLAGVYFFTGLLSLIQTGFDTYHEEDPRFMEIFFGDPDYQLTLSDQGRTLHIKGTIDHGMTKDIRSLLSTNLSVNTVVLNSVGGSIYEARGVAKVIQEYQLATRVDQECSSSCTTAFISGTHRSMKQTAKLGFHQYRFEANYAFPDQQDNILLEQQKDLAFFRSQGVDESFLKQVFETAHDDMWFPKLGALIRSGVVHQLHPSLSQN